MKESWQNKAQAIVPDAIPSSIFWKSKWTYKSTSIIENSLKYIKG